MKISRHKLLAIALKDMVWYHGRAVNSTVFDIKYTGKGHDQEGPGFYFSSDFEDSAHYAGATGIIIAAKIKPERLVRGKPEQNINAIRSLMKRSPHLESALTNFDENRDRAFNMALNSFIETNDTLKDAFQSVWVDIFEKDSEEYLKALIAKRWDAHYATWVREVKHIIVYNPKAIKMVDVFDREGDEWKSRNF